MLGGFRVSEVGPIQTTACLKCFVWKYWKKQYTFRKKKPKKKNNSILVHILYYLLNRVFNDWTEMFSKKMVMWCCEVPCLVAVSYLSLVILFITFTGLQLYMYMHTCTPVERISTLYTSTISRKLKVDCYRQVVYICTSTHNLARSITNIVNEITGMASIWYLLVRTQSRNRYSVYEIKPGNRKKRNNLWIDILELP